MIAIKNERELESMRQACKITAAARALAGDMVRPGVSTKAIDQAVHDFIVHQGAKPSFLNYNGYPASACISVNSTVIHGIPGGYILKEGDIAGLGLLNIPYEWVGITVRNKQILLSYYDLGTDTTLEQPWDKSPIYLRVTGDFEHEWAQFSFSKDGVNYQDIGEKLVVPYQTKIFQGARYALFAFNQQHREGGYAEFDDFTVEEPLADRSKNIPFGKTVSLTNIGNQQRMQANPRKMIYSVPDWAKEYNTPDCFFKILDRGNGKVVLQAMNGTGYVTVAGLGLSGDVRLSAEETEDCLFMWQDMLHGQCMLLSLKTNRYLGLDPASGEAYAADWAGTSASRLNGTVFQWEQAPY